MHQHYLLREVVAVDFDMAHDDIGQDVASLISFGQPSGALKAPWTGFHLGTCTPVEMITMSVPLDITQTGVGEMARTRGWNATSSWSLNFEG